MGHENFGRCQCNFRRHWFPLKGCIKDSFLSCVNQFSLIEEMYQNASGDEMGEKTGSRC